MDISVQDRPILAEHARGDSLRAIGRRHGIGHATAHRVVLAQGSSLIRDLEHDLEAEDWPTILIPYGQQPQDWSDALLMFDWCVKRLRERGFDVEISTRPARAGIVFMLTLPRRRAQ